MTRKENSTNNQNRLEILTTCPILACYDIIDGRWKTHVVWALMNKELRFSEIRKAIPLATERMVARRVRELVVDGLIKPITRGNLKKYALTSRGKTLLPLLKVMEKLGLQFQQNN